MATWIAHLRIADNLNKKITIQNRIPFIIGNIGPDCGVPNEDWSKFDPPADISHWRNDKTREIEHEDFYTKYCSKNYDDFYLGYYVHLLTDDLWGKLVYKKKKIEYAEEMKNDSNFIWTMKDDWYDLDKKYLNDSILESYELFRNVKEFPNIYFDFYPANAFIRQIGYISSFYESRDRHLIKEYKYLFESEMDDFVDQATKEIEEKLKGKMEVIN